MTSNQANEQRLRDLARLRRVRDRIDREYAHPLDVDALARDANMSSRHLSRQFGFEVRNDVGYQGMRWITVGPVGQPDTSIVLPPPAASPGLTGDERTRLSSAQKPPRDRWRHDEHGHDNGCADGRPPRIRPARF